MLDDRRSCLDTARPGRFHEVPGGFQTRYQPSRDYLRASVSSLSLTDVTASRSHDATLSLDARRPVRSKVPRGTWPTLWHKVCHALRLPEKPHRRATTAS
ncbi:hypothetical protein SPRG_07769 [Saprolegnia parasitica CBS 223.65]|uniref:Uncharacterized protein n=1 Tax=Saprolegnia parasitica (strain CBS 223.65) TaxID=695850 RepID=A0A067C969_SAPPC|nr:hypothetical protein SPRG_07769 [Saprolegnia parasitica CBS 223.65]KDO27058.1 hypothetical protein SPRG_07769 [Saprolegnia parasitica CBS 223.65]|eukprot:XP_012202153.1 hypothetical protein SPRG_07769 [Saprolegnia parasitica CBS 223.65]